MVVCYLKKGWEPTFTYRELEEASRRCAHTIERLGVRPGERVVLLLPNCPQFIVAFFGVILAGALVVPLSPEQSASQLKARIADCGARTVITIDLQYRKLLGVLDPTRVERVVVASFNEILGPWERNLLRWTRGRGVPPLRHGDFDFWELIWAMPPYLPEVRLHPDDPAVLIYSGPGTDSRAVVMSHRGLAAGAAQLECWLAGLKPALEMINAILPLAHPIGLQTGLIFPVRMGATTLMFPEPDATRVLRGSSFYGTTIFPAESALLDRLAGHQLLDRHPLESLHTFLNLGPPVSPEARKTLGSRSRGRLTGVHQPADLPFLTHLEPVGAGSSPDIDMRSEAHSPMKASLGLPLPGVECRIVDEAGTPVPAGEAGELQIRGPQVMAGWWDSKTGQPRPHRSGMWHPAGEKARMDKTGHFFLDTGNSRPPGSRPGEARARTR